MINKEILKKKILYRSKHRGTKEMDLLLGNFVKKHINNFDKEDLSDLNVLLDFEDEDLYKWYLGKGDYKSIPINKVSSLLKVFKL